MRASNVPDIVVGRLPLYLRTLIKMIAEGKEITSSQELGGRLGISSAQIRKDLSRFGEFGKQGTGYNIAYLTEQLQRILNVDKVWEIVLVGVGDLGRAVANYEDFINHGFRITLVFDNDPNKIGMKVGRFTVQDVKYLIDDVRAQRIRVAMLAVPVAVAQEVTDQLVEAGIRAILCYAPTSINVPEGVRVEYIDPILHLQHMTHYVP
jgi:redox-sensing transcriptional repressor